MSKYKVLILDFDGTTACTIPGIFFSAHKMLAKYGYDIDKQIVYDNFGLALPEAFQCYAGATFDEATTAKMVEEYNTIYKEEGEQLIELFDGVADALDTLTKAGVKVVIASNNVRPVLDRLTANLGIAQYISDIVSVEDVENVKPAPDIALEVLRRCNISGEEALVVGDSTFDMDMGRGAQCDLCGVTYGSHSAELLRKHGAKYIIDKFGDLIDIVLK